MYPQRKSIERAREFRKNLTPSEARLWTALRQRRLNGLRFRRQHPIGPFIVDFFCPSARLAVEIDGAHHAEDHGQAYDARRDGYLERVGLTVLRIPAEFVRDNLETVLCEIADAAARAAIS
jgi:very-short-patch-repair endonuclease